MSTNLIMYGALDVNPGNGILLSKDAYSLINKFDNGEPDSGNIIAVRGDEYVGSGNNDCTTGDWSASSAEWQLDDEKESCRIIYLLQ